MTAFCHACNRPFVPERNTELSPSRFCPDCTPPKEARQKGTLDCHQYIRSYRVSDRLFEGFEMLAEDPE